MLVAVILQLLMTEVIMVWMFADYRRKGDFSYPMIACGGVAIYILILLAYIVYYYINNDIFSFTYFLSLVTEAGTIVLTILFPLMLLLSVLLAVSNIWLMRHEGFRPVNALGIAFAFVWAVGAFLTVGIYFVPLLWEIPYYIDYARPVIYIVGYMECMFISTVACSYLATKYKAPLDSDYIIILGCAVRSDGTPTPLLKARVDSAAEYEKRLYEAAGRHAVFVPSGGQGPDEVISEGECMQNYLMSSGVPAERIAREDKSVNTLQNMKFSKEVIDSHYKAAREGSGTADSAPKAPKIAFATTNYHVFRGYILAKKLGFSVKGISAKTKPYFFPNAFLREFVGLLADQKWKHLIFAAIIAVFFTLLSRA